MTRMHEIEERCRPFEEDLSALLDGELDAARAALVASHAEGCSACAARLHALRVADQALQGLAERAAPHELDRLARVRHGIAAAHRAEASRAPLRRRPLARLVRPIAAAALAASAAGLYWMTRPAPAPEAIETGVAVAESAPAAPDPSALAAATAKIATSEAFAGRGASAAPEPAAVPGTAPPTPEQAALEASSDEELALAAELHELRVESKADLEVVERLDLLERLDALDAAAPERG